MAGAAALREFDSDIIERAREKLIVALDYWDINDAIKLVDDLGDEVSFYKVGLGLQLAGGDSLAKSLIRQGKRVFLDYKYLDIEETIKTAVKRAAELGQDVKDWGDVDSLPASLRVQPGARAAFRTVWFGVGRGPRIGVGV